MLHASARIALPSTAAHWRDERLGSGLAEIAVDGAIAPRAAGLGDLPGDPVDRSIVATARERGATLLTAEGRLLAWSYAVERQDARG